ARELRAERDGRAHQGRCGRSGCRARLCHGRTRTRRRRGHRARRRAERRQPLSDHRSPRIREPGCRRRVRRVRDGGARSRDPRRARVRIPVTGGTLPRVLAVPALVGLALLVLALVAPVTRVEWSSLGADITSPAALTALGLTLSTALLATLVCVVLGVPLALVIARSGARTSAVLRALVTVPLVLPSMVGGVALLFLFGRRGTLGMVLESSRGGRITFTP